MAINIFQAGKRIVTKESIIFDTYLLRFECHCLSVRTQAWLLSSGDLQCQLRFHWFIRFRSFHLGDHRRRRGCRWRGHLFIFVRLSRKMKTSIERRQHFHVRLQTFQFTESIDVLAIIDETIIAEKNIPSGNTPVDGCHRFTKTTDRFAWISSSIESSKSVEAERDNVEDLAYLDGEWTRDITRWNRSMLA